MSLAIVACLERVVEAGFLHRDIKPENLVLDGDPHGPRVTALDFGSAHKSELSHDAGVLAGTLDYLAPERIRGAPAGEAAEVYALGIVLYELTTLRLPFVSRGRAVLEDHLARLPAMAARAPNVPEAWDRLVLDCLAKDPEQRPATLAQLRQRIQECWAKPHETRSRSAELGAPNAPATSSQLAAVMVLDGATSILPVAATITRLGGFLARTAGQRVTAVFSAADCEAPLEAALAASHALLGEQLIAGAWLHLSAVELGRAPDGAPTVRAAAVDRPEAWREQGTRQGAIFLSTAAADALAQHRERAAPPHLVGRAEALDAIAGSIETWHRESAPVALVLVGTRGVGKTRLSLELCNAARAQTVRVGGSAARTTIRAHELMQELQRIDGATPGASNDDLKETIRALARRAPLALVIDDAELAEDELLDAIEAAMLELPRLPIFAACVGDSRFAKTRPLWGTRLAHFRKLDLPALSPEAARALAAELLRPAEYVPEEALSLLSAAAAHLPGPLCELVGQLRRSSVLRRHSRSNAHYLDTAEVAKVQAPALWLWLATRELSEMDPTVATGVKLVAVLGDGVSRSELAAIQLALRPTPLLLPIDPGVLLERLVERGLLLASGETGDRYVFRVPALAAAFAEAWGADERQLVHRLALEQHTASDLGWDEQLPKIARHATALGRHAIASAAHRKLAEQAAVEQRVVDAETHFSAALASSSDAIERAQLLLGRARIYCRMYRLEESLRDLRDAVELARHAGHDELGARAHFEMATVLDWSGDYAGSGVAALAGIELEARYCAEDRSSQALLARGRSAWRRSQVEPALASLEATLVACQDPEELETKLIARLLLGCALVQAERKAEAEACFALAISEAEQHRDGLHLCAALGNRAFLWAVEGEVERCVADLSRAVLVARRLGHPATERTALLNLSEVLYWAGRDEEAQGWLDQARLLEQRFIERPLHSAVLLQARIALLQQRTPEAIAALLWLAERGLPEPAAQSARAFQAALLHVLRLEAPATATLPEAALTWPEIFELSAGFLGAERAELHSWHQRWLASREAAGGSLSIEPPTA